VLLHIEILCSNLPVICVPRRDNLRAAAGGLILAPLTLPPLRELSSKFGFNFRDRAK
jgi:hypothetical protein